MLRKLSCKICNRPVAKNHQSIQYETCDTWVHRECNKIKKQTHKILQNEKNTKWFCIICTKAFLPLSNLKNEEFINSVKGKKIKCTHAVEKQKSSKIKFFKNINSISVKSGDDRTEYCNPGDINEPENSKEWLNFLHLNISALPYHFPELQILLSSTKVNLVSLESLNQESNKIKTLLITLTFKTTT